MYYSGKKKRHTIKNQLMVKNRGYIINKANHKKGRKHDYIFKNIRRTILLSPPPQVVNVIDLGYLGVEKDYPKRISTLPYKKKRTMSCHK